ncbi:unnamed protein product [Caretta caretta]
MQSWDSSVLRASHFSTEERVLQNSKNMKGQATISARATSSSSKWRALTTTQVPQQSKHRVCSKDKNMKDRARAL